MYEIIENILRFVYLIVLLLFVQKYFLSFKKITTSYALVNLFWVCSLTVFTAECLFILDKISFEILTVFTKTALLGQSSVILTAILMLSIQNLTIKKIKTLWRIPLIGLLCGYSVTFKYLDIVNLGCLLIGLVFLIRKAQYFRFLIRKMIPYIIVSMGIFYFDVNRFWILNIILLLNLVLAGPIFSSLVISEKLRPVEES